MKYRHLDNARRLLAQAVKDPTEDTIQKIWTELSLAHALPEDIDTTRKDLRYLLYLACINKATKLLAEVRRSPSVHKIAIIRSDLKKVRASTTIIGVSLVELEGSVYVARVRELEEHFAQLRRIPTRHLIEFVREKIKLSDVEYHPGELDELEQKAIELEQKYERRFSSMAA